MDNPAAPIPPIPAQPAVSSLPVEALSKAGPAESSNRRWLLWLAGGLFMLIIGIALGLFTAKFIKQTPAQSSVSSYEDCLAAKGSIVQESYPATCVTTSGQRFVQPLTDEEKQGLQPPDLYHEQNDSAATADWKTYINNKCRYKVKYPPDWTLLPEPENAIYGAAVIFPYEVGSGVRPPDDWLKVQIGCAVKASNRSPQSIVDELSKRDSGYGVSQIQSFGQINLNGNPGFKQLNIPPNGSSVLEYYVFPEGDRYYSLGFTPGDTKQTDIIDQILSTFHFLK